MERLALGQDRAVGDHHAAVLALGAVQVRRGLSGAAPTLSSHRLGVKLTGRPGASPSGRDGASDRRREAATR